MNRIYLEYLVNGKFCQEFFTSWQDYFAATFSPDVEILNIVVR